MSIDIPETPAFTLDETDLQAAVKPATTYDGTKPMPVLLKALFTFLAAQKSTVDETRDEVIALDTDVRNLIDSTVTTLATKAAQADLVSLTTTVGTKAAQTDLAALTTAVAGKATQADITAAINALKGSAPALLDTLAEIATQLTSDETAAGALTTAVASKAPLASPALTGSPTVNGAPLATTTTAAGVAAGMALVFGG